MKIFDEVKCDVVFITLGEKGIFYNDKNHKGIVECNVKRIGDSCGCGDIVNAVISCLYRPRMSEEDLRSMLEIANDFAGINMTKIGAGQINILDWFNHQRKPILISMAQSIILSKYFRSKHQKVGITTGCFDLFHVGHLKSLEFGSKECDFFFVYLNSDKSIRALKGITRPVVALPHRLEMLMHLQIIDFIVVFNRSAIYIFKNDVLILHSICNKIHGSWDEPFQQNKNNYIIPKGKYKNEIA